MGPRGVRRFWIERWTWDQEGSGGGGRERVLGKTAGNKDTCRVSVKPSARKLPESMRMTLAQTPSNEAYRA